MDWFVKTPLHSELCSHACSSIENAPPPEGPRERVPAKCTDKDRYQTSGKGCQSLTRRHCWGDQFQVANSPKQSAAKCREFQGAGGPLRRKRRLFRGQVVGPWSMLATSSAASSSTCPRRVYVRCFTAKVGKVTGGDCQWFLEGSRRVLGKSVEVFLSGHLCLHCHVCGAPDLRCLESLDSFMLLLSDTLSFRIILLLSDTL